MDILKPWQAPTGDWQQQNWGQQDQQWQWGDNWTAPAPSTNDAVGSGNVGSGNVGNDGDGGADNAARPAPDTTPSRPTGPSASPLPRPGPSCIICLEGVSGYPIFLPCAHGPFHHHCLVRTLAATNQHCPICRYETGQAWKKLLESCGSLCFILLSLVA